MRLNARQIREQRWYNGTTLEMVGIRELLKQGDFLKELTPEQPLYMSFPKYKIIDRIKEVRKAHERG